MTMPTDAKSWLDIGKDKNLPQKCILFIYFPVSKICVYVHYIGIPTHTSVSSHITFMSLQEDLLEDSALYEISTLSHKCTGHSKSFDQTDMVY